MISTHFSRALAVGAIVALQLPAALAKDELPFTLEEIKGRDGKEIYRAAFGRGGRIGTFRDVDSDGQTEFVSVSEDGRDIVLTVLELETDEPRLSFVVGENEPAGLATINLDGDPELEYVVGYGSQLGERLKQALIMFASALGTFSAGWTAAGAQYFVVLNPGANVDLRHVRAFDDDGTPLWDRDVGPDGEAWRNARFKWVAPDPDGRGATILLTDDGENRLVGVSAEDGSTRWSRSFNGVSNPSGLSFKPLVDGDRQLPVLFSSESILVIEPVSGDPILETMLDRSISALPSWNVFSVPGGKGFLTFGEDRGELRMHSLTTGELIWSHSMARVQDVIPLASGSRLMAIWEEGVQILESDGELASDVPAPGEIRKRTVPVYADLNGDGTMEFIFVSDKKNVVAWRPETGEQLWTSEAGKSLVGAANPIRIYDSPYDMDDDGWLDIPTQKPSGAGVWLSGRTGNPLTEVGNGTADPIVGDFDGNGAIEMFWAKKWYDIVPTGAD